VDSDTFQAKLKAADDALGIAAAFTHPQLQQDAFKELVNKLAWAFGSTYRKPYSGVRSPARQYALAMAQVAVQVHGYPMKIGILEPKPKPN